jgi:branched-chain amino acid transport system permease protein
VTGRASLIAVGVFGLALLIGLPLAVETFTLVDVTVFVILSILALSLALVWGMGGILCFGQSAFFGLGGYAYALAVLNMGESTLPVLAGIVLPMLFAALLGYFMFWGRVSDVYLAVITLTVSLILFHLINSTSGPEYRLGSAPLGGANGIPGVPPINVPGDPGRQLGFDDMFQLAMAVLLLTYFGLRALLASHFGRVVVSIRENELRAELLGYDARRYKLAVFVIGAGIAGLSGVLFTNWGSFIGPNVFSIVFTAQIIIWLMVGGVGTLGGAILGTVIIQFLTTWLGETKLADTNLVLGAIFVLFVLLVPSGLQPKFQEWARALVARRGRSEAP